MKKSLSIVSLILVLTIQSVVGQSKFAFHKNNTLYLSNTEGIFSSIGEDITIKQNKKLNTSTYFTYSTMPRLVLNEMTFSDGMAFYSALQSTESNAWIFVERNMNNSSFNLCSFDTIRKIKEIIFTQDNSPDSNYAFNAIAWSNEKEIVYLEALIFGSATENEGIWSYNLMTKQFSKLSISSSYLITPIISPDRRYLIYGGTTDIRKDLDSPLNLIFVYDLVTNSTLLK